MEWIALNVDGVFNVVTTVISVAAAIAALFPRATAATGVIAQVRRFVDLIAMNWGNARNSD